MVAIGSKGATMISAEGGSQQQDLVESVKRTFLFVISRLPSIIGYLAQIPGRHIMPFKLLAP